MIAHKLALVALVAVFARGCDSKIVVDHITKPTTTDDGVIYMLPNTVARLQLKVDKTTAQGAIYSPFIAIFAPDAEPVCKFEPINKDTYKKCLEGYVTYSLQQATTFSTYGEPAKEHVYLVRFVGKGHIDQSVSMTWTETGLLSAASSTVTNRTSDVVLAGLKTVTGLGIKLALGAPADAEPAASPTPTPKPKDCGKDSVEQDKWVVPVLVTAGDTAPALIENYCAIKKADRQKYPAKGDIAIQSDDGVQKTFEDLLRSAVQTYITQIAKLIDTRTSILFGNDRIFQSADLLPHLEAEISKKLTSNFIGSKKPLTWEGSVDVRDFLKLNIEDMDKNTGALLDVLHIKEDEGICLKKDLATLAPDSKPIPAKFKVLEGTACNDAPAVQLRVEFFPKSDAQLFTRVAPATEGERSFRYRVPAQVKATLCDSTNEAGKYICDEKKKTYGSAVFSVAQLGKVISLPATRHSKSLTYDLTLIDSTGGLKTFKLGTTGGLDPAMIETLGGVAGSIIEARQKGDEINQLTRQQQLLKLQDEICTIQKKYGLDCTTQPQ